MTAKDWQRLEYADEQSNGFPYVSPRQDWLTSLGMECVSSPFLQKSGCVCGSGAGECISERNQVVPALHSCLRLHSAFILSPCFQKEFTYILINS